MSDTTEGLIAEIDDGPEWDTCGNTTCPDADMPGFSESQACAYASIYHALRDARDCDYGCARDYTNQAVRLKVVQAVERIVTGREIAAVRAAQVEISEMLDGFPAAGRHTRARWAVRWLEHIIERLEAPRG